MAKKYTGNNRQKSLIMVSSFKNLPKNISFVIIYAVFTVYKLYFVFPWVNP